MGVRLAVIVAQRSEKVRRYVADNHLPLDLLIDEGRDVLTAYGVWHPLAASGTSIVRPALFAIDTAGTVCYAFVAQQQHEFPGFEEIAAVIGDAGRGWRGPAVRS